MIFACHFLYYTTGKGRKENFYVKLFFLEDAARVFYSEIIHLFRVSFLFHYLLEGEEFNSSLSIFKYRIKMRITYMKKDYFSIFPSSLYYKEKYIGATGKSDMY
jgi:hypothetical protein